MSGGESTALLSILLSVILERNKFPQISCGETQYSSVGVDAAREFLEVNPPSWKWCLVLVCSVVVVLYITTNFLGSDCPASANFYQVSVIEAEK